MISVIKNALEWVQNHDICEQERFEVSRLVVSVNKNTLELVETHDICDQERSWVPFPGLSYSMKNYDILVFDRLCYHVP